MNEFYPFSSFDPELKRKICSVAYKTIYNSGDKLVVSKLALHSVLLIVKGKLKVFTEDNEGREFYLYQLETGQVCVHSISGRPVSQSINLNARVTSDGTEIWYLPSQYVNTWMTKYSCWNQFVVQSFQMHITQLLSIMELVLFKKLDARLEFYLKSHQKIQKKRNMRISHQEIANEINTSRESVSRTLKKMELLGKVKLGRNHIELVED